MSEPWIPVVGEGEAAGALAEAYGQVRERIGHVGKMMRIHSLNPEVVVGHLEQFMAVMFSRTDLTREQREMIAVVVSAENGCGY